MPIKKLWGREKKSEREENKTVRKQWPLHRVTEWCLSLRLGRALFSDRRFCGLPSSHSTHRLKGFASGWHNERVCVCVCACLCMCKCTLEGPCCVEPECECDSLRGRRGRGFVQAHARGCVCAFDVMFVHSVVAMASSLTPDAQEKLCPNSVLAHWVRSLKREKKTHTHTNTCTNRHTLSSFLCVCQTWKQIIHEFSPLKFSDLWSLVRNWLQACVHLHTHLYTPIH